MFCPQCSHQQASHDTRFCSRCGLSLDLITDLLVNSGDQLQREKQEILGVSLMMATTIMLVNFIIVFGVITLPHLTNPVFLWIWASFVISFLSTGGIGLAKLIRSGFFKKLKEREMRLNLMKLAQERQRLPEGSNGVSTLVESKSPLIEPSSVTEMTTRELQVIPKQTDASSRQKENEIND